MKKVLIIIPIRDYIKELKIPKTISLIFLKWVGRDNVIGYGASTKGNIVLNQCNLTSKNLKLICDANPYKYNRYTPVVILE